MSLPALQPSAGATPAAANPHQDAAARSGGGAAFDALISKLAGEKAQPNAQAASNKGAPATKDQQSGEDGASESQNPTSIESDLAGLVLGALPTKGQLDQQGSDPSGSKKRASSEPASGQAVDPSAAQAAISAALAQGAVNPAISAVPATGPLWRSSDRAQAAASLTAAASTATIGDSANLPPSGAEPSLAALASAAAKSGGASFANAGALEAPQAGALLAADPVMFTVEQNRTHLGVDGAAQTLAKDPILRAQSDASVTAAAATSPAVAPAMAARTAAVSLASAQGVAGSPAAAAPATAASLQGRASPDARARGNRVAAQATATTASNATDVAASRAAAPASAGAQNETGSQKRSSRDSQQNAASAAPAAPQATTATSAAAVLAATGASAPVSLGPIAPDRLAATISSQAAQFVSQAAPAGAAAPGSASVSGSQPVKELEIKLDPADLGEVSVKMRLSDGKLSVVVEVSKPSTLKAVEGDRDAIAARLGSSVQSLESLIIKPSAANTQAAAQGNADASGQKFEGRDNAQSDPRGNGDSQSGQQAPRRDDSANPRSSQSPSYQPVAGRGFGDMVV